MTSYIPKVTVSLIYFKIPGGITVYKAAENMTAKLGLESLSPEFWTLSWFNSSCPANVVNYCENGKPR
jgi:hypothetical protein